MDDELEKGGGDGADMGVVTLMLGLYLIILAFFILLNAISQDSAEKRDLVVESVMEGFDFQDEGDLLGPDDAEITAIPAYSATQEAITGVIQTYLSFQEYDIQEKGNRMFVSMDIRRFFRHGDVKLIPEMILFFEDLGRILSHKNAGVDVLTSIVARGDQTDFAEGSTPLVTAGVRSTLFVRALLEQGVKPELLSASALEETPRMLMLFDIVVKDPQAAATAQTALEGAMQNLGKAHDESLTVDDDGNTVEEDMPEDETNAQTTPE